MENDLFHILVRMIMWSLEICLAYGKSSKNICGLFFISGFLVPAE